MSDGMRWASGLDEKARTDDEIVADLQRIDEDDDVECSDWECEFLDSIKKMPKPRRLSPKQRAAAEKMVEKYL